MSGLTGVGGTASETSAIVVLALVVAFVLYRQLRPQRYRGPRMLLWPVLLVLLSLTTIHGADLTGRAAVVFFVPLAFALVAGAARGLVNQVDRRADGSVWILGGWAGVALYVATLALHYGLDAVLHVSSPALLASSLPLYMAAIMVGRFIGLQAKLARTGPPPGPEAAV